MKKTRLSRLMFLVLFFSTSGILAESLEIRVSDPKRPILVELPRGNTDLKTFRADTDLIESYAEEVQLTDALKKDHPKAPDCTRAEIRALKDYANDTFLEINAALRELTQGKVKGKPLSKELESKILMVASGVNCAPQFSGTVVRMEYTPDSILSQYLPGNFIVMRAFTSTSKGTIPAPSVIRTGRGQKILIHNAQGADIDVLNISTWAGEKEVLIRPGTIFKIVSRTDNPPPSPVKNEFLFDQYSDE